METMEVHQIEKRNSNSLYGLSWFPNTEQIVYADSVVDPMSLVSESAYRESGLGILRIGEETHDLSLIAPHQILCTNDGNVLLVDTGDNSIILFNPTTRKILKELSITSSRFDRFDPRHGIGDHLNTIHIHADKLYALGHGHHKFSKLATFSYPGLELEEVRVLENRSGLHNLYLNQRNEMVSCNSLASSLVDLNTDKELWFAPSRTHGFLKGLAVSNEFMFVGGSRFSSRESRVQSETTIWVIDPENFKTLAHYNLGEFGPVQDIRIASHEDKAHNASTLKGIYELLYASHKQVSFATQLDFYGKSSSPIENLNLCGKFARYSGSGFFDFDGNLHTESRPETWLAKRPSDSRNLKVLLPKVEIQYLLHSTPSSCSILFSTDASDSFEQYFSVGISADKVTSVELWETNKKESSLIATLSMGGVPEFGVLSMHMSEEDILVKISNTETGYSADWSIKDLVDFECALARKIGFKAISTTIHSANLTWDEIDYSQKRRRSESSDNSKSKRGSAKVKKLVEVANRHTKGKTK